MSAENRIGLSQRLSTVTVKPGVPGKQPAAAIRQTPTTATIRELNGSLPSQQARYENASMYLHRLNRTAATAPERRERATCEVRVQNALGTVKCMDKAEARLVAAGVLDEWRPVPFAELSRLVDQSVWVDRVGPSGASYSVKMYGLWDAGVVGGDLRVVAAAVDGSKTRLGLLRSVDDDFIVTPGDQSART